MDSLLALGAATVGVLGILLVRFWNRPRLEILHLSQCDEDYLYAALVTVRNIGRRPAYPHSLRMRVIDFEVAEGVSRPFIEARDITLRSGHQPWGKARFRPYSVVLPAYAPNKEGRAWFDLRLDPGDADTFVISGLTSDRLGDYSCVTRMLFKPPWFASLLRRSTRYAADVHGEVPPGVVIAAFSEEHVPPAGGLRLTKCLFEALKEYIDDRRSLLKGNLTLHHTARSPGTTKEAKQLCQELGADVLFWGCTTKVGSRVAVQVDTVCSEGFRRAGALVREMPDCEVRQEDFPNRFAPTQAINSESSLLKAVKVALHGLVIDLATREHRFMTALAHSNIQIQIAPRSHEIRTTAGEIYARSAWEYSRSDFQRESALQLLRAAELTSNRVERAMALYNAAQPCLFLGKRRSALICVIAALHCSIETEQPDLHQDTRNLLSLLWTRYCGIEPKPEGSELDRVIEQLMSGTDPRTLRRQFVNARTAAGRAEPIADTRILWSVEGPGTRERRLTRQRSNDAPDRSH